MASGGASSQSRLCFIQRMKKPEPIISFFYMHLLSLMYRLSAKKLIHTMIFPATFCLHYDEQIYILNIHTTAVFFLFFFFFSSSHIPYSSL